MSALLRMWQDVVNEHAQKRAIVHDIPSSNFSVTIVAGLKRGNDLQVISGPVVQIRITWPKEAKTPREIATHFNRLVEAAFQLIIRKRLWTPMELPTRVYSFRVPDEKKRIKRWLVHKLNGETEVVNLIAPERIKVDMSVTIRYTDMITGEYIEQKHVNNHPLNAIYVTPEWVELSNQVYIKHPEELLDDDTNTSPTHSETDRCYSARDRGVAIVLRTAQVV